MRRLGEDGIVFGVVQVVRNNVSLYDRGFVWGGIAPIAWPKHMSILVAVAERGTGW